MRESEVRKLVEDVRGPHPEGAPCPFGMLNVADWSELTCALTIDHDGDHDYQEVAD